MTEYQHSRHLTRSSRLRSDQQGKGLGGQRCDYRSHASWHSFADRRSTQAPLRRRRCHPPQFAPVRTFADWRDPSPGLFEINGPKIVGDYLHTLVLTNIASGWTECVAMRFRSQALVIDGLDKVAEDLLFPTLGLDSDNDSAFMTQDVFDSCKHFASWMGLCPGNAIAALAHKFARLIYSRLTRSVLRIA
jgi:hypothetical protein